MDIHDLLEKVEVDLVSGIKYSNDTCDCNIRRSTAQYDDATQAVQALEWYCTVVVATVRTVGTSTTTFNHTHRRRATGDELALAINQQQHFTFILVHSSYSFFYFLILYHHHRRAQHHQLRHSKGGKRH
jgi:hypothetical protein